MLTCVLRFAAQTRGNLYMKYTDVDEDIQDPKGGKPIKKYVFIVFFQGDKLQVKIKKICESFDANLYPCPDTAPERKELLSQVRLEPRCFFFLLLLFFFFVFEWSE